MSEFRVATASMELGDLPTIDRMQRANEGTSPLPAHTGLLSDRESAAVGDLSIAAFRKQIARGLAPAPCTRGRWHSSDIWLWAVGRGACPLSHAPLSAWRDAPAIQGFRLVRTGFTNLGAQAIFVSTTPTEQLMLCIVYPARHPTDLIGWHHSAVNDLTDGLLEPVDIVVEVATPSSAGGDIPTTAMNRHNGIRESMPLDDVAALLGAVIPYWPVGLRGRAVNLYDHDRAPDACPLVPAESDPPEELVGFERVAAQSSEAAELAALLAASITYAAALEQEQAYQAATADAEAVVSRVAPWSALAPGQYLHIAAKPDAPSRPAWLSPVEFRRLVELVWAVPVGESPATRRAAELAVTTGVAADGSFRRFHPKHATAAQRDFYQRLQPIPAQQATIAHLAQGSQARSVTRFLSDPLTGAAVAEDPDGWLTYSAPPVDHAGRRTAGLGPAIFDFTAPTQPFLWSEGQRALPLPDAGLLFGDELATCRAVAAALELPIPQSLPPGWPLNSHTHADRYTAATLRQILQPEASPAS